MSDVDNKDRKPPRLNDANKPAKAKSELLQRIVFGLLLAGVAFFITWLGGFAFQAFVAVFAIVMFVEYRKICSAVIPLRVAGIAFAFLLLIMTSWIFKFYDTAIILTLFAALSLWAWEALIKRTGWGALGLIYVILPFFALVHIRGATEEGFHATLFLFACVWGADTMAFVVGKLVGGPKLIPVISPGKTWSGFFGGLIGGVLIAAVVMKLSGYNLKPTFYAIGLVLVFISQIGDLAESALKRKFNVKDSGSIIPGHGGVLDRVDGLIFSSVVAWLFALSYSGVFFGKWTWEPAIELISAIATR